MRVTTTRENGAIAYHEACGEHETFIGNCDFNDIKARVLPKHLRVIPSARLGELAYDIKGEPLPECYRPIFIAKADSAQYNRIMDERLRHIRAGEKPD